MKDKEIELRIEKKAEEVKHFARDEAVKARRWATASFTAVVGFFSIILTLGGYLGIQRIAQDSVNNFLKERGVNESLDSLTSKKKIASSLADSTREELKKAQTATKEILSVTGRLPGIIDKKEAHVDADYQKINGSFRVPYINNAYMEKDIRIKDTSDTYLLIFAYRVRGLANNMRFTHINIFKKDNLVKQIILSGIEGKSTEFGSSGAVVISKLEKGEYKVRLEDYSDAESDRKYLSNRQFTIYKLQ